MPDETLYFQVKYDRAFFSATRVEEVLQTFRAILENIASASNELILHVVGQPLAHTPEPESNARDLLPTRGVAVVRREDDLHLPETPREQALADIWREVLDLPVVDVETRFLALGGNSLAAMRILAHSQQDGFDFELTDLFGEHSTVRKLAHAASLAVK